MPVPQYAQRAALALGVGLDQLHSYRQEGDQVVILVDRGIGGITKHTLAVADLPPLPKPEPEPESAPKVVTKRPAKRSL